MTRSAHIAEALHAAFCLLADAESALGRDLRADLAASTGLSVPMIEWGLRTSLPTDREVLVHALRRAPRAGERRVSVILSGNLFTACVRALGWPLLLGATVTAKAAIHDDVLPRALQLALIRVAPEVAAHLNVRTFDRSDRGALQELVAACDVVSAYGSDATLAAIRQTLPAEVSLVPHGHGVGVLYVSPSALESPVTAQHWAERAALDVAAYDQRGCLSPHVIFVNEGCAVTTDTFARALAAALADLEHALPRGILSEQDVIAQSQWRGLMASCGDLIEATTFAVAQLDPEAPLPSFTGPGYRNVCVVPCTDSAAFTQRVTPLAEHLKCIGVAGGETEWLAVTAALPPSLRPVLCAAGDMQKPAFDATADGVPPWHGLA